MPKQIKQVYSGKHIQSLNNRNNYFILFLVLVDVEGSIQLKVLTGMNVPPYPDLKISLVSKRLQNY